MQICRYRNADGRPALGAISRGMKVEQAGRQGELPVIHRLGTDVAPFPDMDEWLARPDALAFAREAVSLALKTPPVSFLFPNLLQAQDMGEPRRLDANDLAEEQTAPLFSSLDAEEPVRIWPPNRERPVALHGVPALAPIQSQEVWGAGVTYERSRVARMEESASGGSFYDLVYTAERPELFFKATPGRVVGPGEPIRIRRDSTWDVPEPELALVISASGEIVGYTVGNDVSSRSIEGENPLYLPQAKVYDGCCALGPLLTLAGDGGITEPRDLTLRLVIRRGEYVAFESEVSTSRMRRPPEELVEYLFRDNTLPNGAILLTGTGIVPPDEFTLQSGDRVEISIDGIGTLVNPVA